MSEHPCPLPKRYWWRHGRMWQCACGKQYWLLENYYGDDITDPYSTWHWVRGDRVTFHG